MTISYASLSYKYFVYIGYRFIFLQTTFIEISSTTASFHHSFYLLLTYYTPLNGGFLILCLVHLGVYIFCRRVKYIPLARSAMLCHATYLPSLDASLLFCLRCLRCSFLRRYLNMDSMI